MSDTHVLPGSNQISLTTIHVQEVIRSVCPSDLRVKKEKQDRYGATILAIKTKCLIR